MTQDSNAGERDTPQTEAEIDPAKAREAQEIADGHRYQTQAFRDAREAAKPGAEFKKAREAKKAAPKKNLKDANPKGGERIAKVLARAGLASRREIERLVGLGKIAVNGRILETPAVLVNAQDVITVEGRPIGKAEPTRLWRYHKPVGLMTTHSDPQGRPTVFENMPQPMPRVISVGRLDMNSEGLLLLTNDGELARALELPATGWVRVYRARALGQTSQAQLDRLKNGTTVEGVIYGPMDATLDKKVDKADGRANVWLTVAITEGKNREVRKVLESIGLKVNRLIRLAYGPFQLGNLETGEVEEVGPRVIRELLSDKIDARNLPPEGASQTLDAPKPRGARDDAAPAGRRGGGDRFKSSAPRDGKSFGTKPFGDRKFGDKPRGPRPDFVEKREYKERDFDERPRFEGDGEARDRREWKPRPESRTENRTEGRDRVPGKKPYAPRTFGEKPAGERAWKPRPEGQERGPAKKPYGAKSYGTKTQGDKPAGERAWKPRPEGQSAERSTERKTWTPRPEGRSDDRPRFKPREDRDGGEGGRNFGDKPRYGAKPGRPAFKKPYADKPEGGRPFDRKPYARKPSGGDDIPAGEAGAYERAKREFGGNQRPRREASDRPQGERPAFKKAYASRPDGDRKPRFERAGDGAAKSGGFKGRDFKSPRPSGDRPSGGRPAGKPGGFTRKPRRED